MADMSVTATPTREPTRFICFYRNAKLIQLPHSWTPVFAQVFRPDLLLLFGAAPSET